MYPAVEIRDCLLRFELYRNGLRHKSIERVGDGKVPVRRLKIKFAGSLAGLAQGGLCKGPGRLRSQLKVVSCVLRAERAEGKRASRKDHGQRQREICPTHASLSQEFLANLSSSCWLSV